MNDSHSSLSTYSIPMDSLSKTHMRLANFSLLCSAFVSNFLLSFVLLSVGRRQCSTYFLLFLMSICDCLYCAVHLSIFLTIDHYINIINHQILCPLSFFLTPFTFTGSTLFLLICLIHFITNYVRKYDTVLGQIGGRLSVVFVLAFVIIRSVLGSTSVELIILDPHKPDSHYCTIDMNTTELVEAVQNITHIFSELTDILVYLAWMAVLLVYVINLMRCKQSYFYDDMESTTQLAMAKPLSYASLLILYNNNNVDLAIPPNTVTIASDGTTTDALNTAVEGTGITVSNKRRHRDLSVIILCIACVSIVLYLPIMVGKYSTLYMAYCKRSLFDHAQMDLLQSIQHTAHSLCLSVRFIPYVLFDRRVHSFLHELVGMKCVRVDGHPLLSRS